MRRSVPRSIFPALRTSEVRAGVRYGVTDDVTVTGITGVAVTGVTRDVMGRDVTAAFFLARYALARSAGVLALLG
jgi:hypothetical protein